MPEQNKSHMHLRHFSTTNRRDVHLYLTQFIVGGGGWVWMRAWVGGWMDGRLGGSVNLFGLGWAGLDVWAGCGLV